MGDISRIRLHGQPGFCTQARYVNIPLRLFPSDPCCSFILLRDLPDAEQFGIPVYMTQAITDQDESDESDEGYQSGYGSVQGCLKCCSESPTASFSHILLFQFPKDEHSHPRSPILDC
jgi:hypothetical protein